jgi:hypothetical protein
MIPCAAQNVDVSKPLRDQKKPDFVCDPGDPRVEKYGWTGSNFRGYLSMMDQTIWISAVYSLNPKKGNLSRLIRSIHAAGYQIKVPSPFPHMVQICEHLGFRETIEHFPEAEEDIIVYVLEPELSE